MENIYQKEGITMPAYVVVEITVNDAKTYERYKQLAPGGNLPSMRLPKRCGRNAPERR